MDPEIGDRIVYAGRIGTVVQIQRFEGGIGRWLVVACDCGVGEIPTKRWVAPREWDTLTLISRAADQAPRPAREA